VQLQRHAGDALRALAWVRDDTAVDPAALDELRNRPEKLLVR
jgi:hypothetical protein